MGDLKLNKLTLANVISVVTSMLKDGDSYRVSIKPWREKRSLSANAQYAVWLPEISNFYGEDVAFIRKWMKHEIGFNILVRGGCDYSKQVLYVLEKSGYYQLNVNQQINMLNLFSVTSVMNTKQHCELRDEVQIYWAKQGLNLRYKDKNG